MKVFAECVLFDFLLKIVASVLDGPASSRSGVLNIVSDRCSGGLNVIADFHRRRLDVVTGGGCGRLDIFRDPFNGIASGHR